LAVFTDTGVNLSAGRRAWVERREWKKTFPAAIRVLGPMFNLMRLLEKIGRGCYRQRLPMEYEIFTSDSGAQRRKFTARTARFRWRLGIR
jgi:hypothetical protein